VLVEVYDAIQLKNVYDAFFIETNVTHEV
jgi:hypothetical protein